MDYFSWLSKGGRKLQQLTLFVFCFWLSFFRGFGGRASCFFAGAPAPIFIIGAPRTGSTIFYQAVTNYFDVLYFDNVVAFWFRAIFFGFKRSFSKYGNSPHNCFSSTHGATLGGHSPSECGEFWYRWLPKDRHFLEKADPAVASAIRREVNEVSSYFGKPLVFKNLNAGQRLRLIVEAFPDARIVFIRRNPRFVLRSILSARRKLGVTAGRWWSVRPPNFENYLDLPEAEMCAAQIFHIEKQVLEDLALFPKQNVFVVNYDEMAADSVKNLGSALGLVPRKDGCLPEFSKDSVDAIAAEELEILDRALSRYPFAELTYEG